MFKYDSPVKKPNSGINEHHTRASSHWKKLTEKKIQAFLEILKKKPDTAYVRFTEALKRYQPDLLQILQPPGRPQSKRGCWDGQASAASTAPQEFLRNLTVADLQKRLRPALEQEHLDDSVIGSILDALEKAGIDGEVFLEMTGEDFKENFPELIFGHRKKLIIIRDHFLKDQDPYKLQENTDTEVKKIKPCLQRTEYVREFGQEPTTFHNYQKGKYLNKHEERAGNLINPVRQFFPCSFRIHC
ncbi:uncharacterized protein LOC112573782 [Pomacea canaliculata]|uniref:uncharacterized protein LOC112573782 n=1 Tax=Pomacea canaliculata TaxID=400727 RepID=UPI000D735703|nr:uncharacterized protein LOC112573782 [Pomacea canaliculata]